MFYSNTLRKPNNNIKFTTTLCTWINANMLYITMLLTVFGMCEPNCCSWTSELWIQFSMCLVKQNQGYEHWNLWLVRHPSSRKTNRACTDNALRQWNLSVTKEQQVNKSKCRELINSFVLCSIDRVLVIQSVNQTTNNK